MLKTLMNLIVGKRNQEIIKIDDNVDYETLQRLVDKIKKSGLCLDYSDIDDFMSKKMCTEVVRILRSRAVDLKLRGLVDIDPCSGICTFYSASRKWCEIEYLKGSNGVVKRYASYSVTDDTPIYEYLLDEHNLTSKGVYFDRDGKQVVREYDAMEIIDLFFIQRNYLYGSASVGKLFNMYLEKIK